MYRGHVSFVAVMCSHVQHLQHLQRWSSYTLSWATVGVNSVASVKGFNFSTHASASQVAATQLELANDVVHNKRHLCCEQEEI